MPRQPNRGRLPGGLAGRAVVALGVACLLLGGLGCGAAFAFFTGHGGGSGTVTVADGLEAVTLAAGTAAGTPLYPGATGDLVVTATNPNGVPVTVTSFAIGSVSGCTIPDLTLNTTTFTIPAHSDSTHPITLTGALSMGMAASDDCQDKTLTVHLADVVVQQ